MLSAHRLTELAAAGITRREVARAELFYAKQKLLRPRTLKATGHEHWDGFFAGWVRTAVAARKRAT